MGFLVKKSSKMDKKWVFWPKNRKIHNVWRAFGAFQLTTIISRRHTQLLKHIFHS